MSIGTQIKELLYERKLSQKQLAEELKIPPTTLSGYIRDFREPDIETLMIIAKYFHVTLDYLLGFNLEAITHKEGSLNEGEIELLNVYRNLKKDQQELLIEQGKLLVKMNNKKSQTSSVTTFKKDSAKTK